MVNGYAYKIGKALVWPDLSAEFAADVINGNVRGADIWKGVCTLVGGWCNDANVFLAWDKMGRPDESEYLEPEYDMEQDPERRHAIVANARISAMADMVADALVDVVDDIVVNEGWKCISAAQCEDAAGVGWLEEGCGALGVYTESYLVKPDGK